MLFRSTPTAAPESLGGWVAANITPRDLEGDAVRNEFVQCPTITHADAERLARLGGAQSGAELPLIDQVSDRAPDLWTSSWVWSR